MKQAILLLAVVALTSGCSIVNTYYKAQSAMVVTDALETVVNDDYAKMTKTSICLPPGSERDRATRIAVVMGWTELVGNPTDPCVNFSKEAK